MKRHPIKTIAAFSLPELLIVLAITAILSMLALPSLTAHWQHTTATTLQSELQRAITLARHSAFSLHTTTRLCGSTDMKTCDNNWQNGFIILAHTRVIYAYQNFSVAGKLHARFFPRDYAYLNFSPQAASLEQNGSFWYCINPTDNPVWAIAFNKISRIREIQPDSTGKMRDDKYQVLSCA